MNCGLPGQLENNGEKNKKLQGIILAGLHEPLEQAKVTLAACPSSPAAGHLSTSLS